MNPSMLRRQFGAVVLMCTGLVLSGCATHQTRVTLLPDQGGHVGAVSVSSAQGRQQIDQAFSTVTVEESSAMDKPRAVDQQGFEQSHRALLDAQPTPPLSFMLNFLFDSMKLTPESEKMLPALMQAVRERIPTEVTVFGYADASGTAAYNLALSAERARAVARVLQKIDPDLKVDVQYFGDKVPLVPSPPGKPEPRNRRAEIVVL